MVNNSSSSDKNIVVDPELKSKIIQEIIQKGSYSEIDFYITKANKTRETQIRWVLSDLYRHDYLYSQLLKMPEDRELITDKLVYRVFYPTEKFTKAVDKGEKIE